MVLDKVVSHFQSAFVEGIFISDNYIISHEILHSFKKKRKNKKLALKLDIFKAYDRVKWNFVTGTLKVLGFMKTLLARIAIECISSLSFIILLNESPFNNFNPSRGSRQGNPLSPYLFIIGMEILSQLHINAEDKGDIRGIKIAKNAPSISHLFFVDNSCIVCSAHREDVREVKSIQNCEML